jgi:hypothetical protein
MHEKGFQISKDKMFFGCCQIILRYYGMLHDTRLTTGDVILQWRIVMLSCMLACSARRIYVLSACSHCNVLRLLLLLLRPLLLLLRPLLLRPLLLRPLLLRPLLLRPLLLLLLWMFYVPAAHARQGTANCQAV